MKQVLIHENQELGDISGKAFAVQATKANLPELKFTQGITKVEVPCKFLRDGESLFVAAEISTVLAYNGLYITVAEITPESICVYFWSPAPLTVKQGALLATLKLVEVCSYRQIRTTPQIQIFGETVNVDRPSKRKARKSRQTQE